MEEEGKGKGKGKGKGRVVCEGKEGEGRDG